MREGNPYNLFLEMLDGRYKNPEKIVYWGVVVSEKPLKIKTENIIIDEFFLKITENFKKKYKKDYKITCTHGTIEHNICTNLKTGDEVLMIKRLDKFVLIDKVVDLNE